MHGFEVAKRAIEAGEGYLIAKDDDDGDEAEPTRH
jgi:hypothetical protein